MNTTLIIFAGLIVWAFAALGVAIAGVLTNEMWGYYLLIGCRAFVGVGEAAFIPVAPTMLDNVVSKKHRTV